MQISRLATSTPILSHLLPRRPTPRTFLPHPQKAHLSTRPRPSTLRNLLFRRHASNTPPPSNPPSPNVTPNLGSPAPSLTLSQRMRKLSREYGWAAFGVYMGLSALDFPFCFLAVRIIGTERIGHWEHVIVGAIKSLIPYDFGSSGEGKEKAVGEGGGDGGSLPRPTPKEPAGKPEEWSWGVEEAQKEAKRDDATIWTQLALAYAIHKSFIFIRVPLTAAVTPKVVKTLRGWGWDIGKRKPKSS